MFGLINKTFGRYEIREALGKGGMGEVYIAQDTRLKRPVALKVLLEKYTEDEICLRRFEQEAFAASALNHPHILTVHDIGMVEGRHFIATEFVEGETLRKRMARGTLAIGDALGIILQVADALIAAHKASIVHRDIKPENIMLRSDGYVKLLDFGLAKLISGQAEAGLETLPGVIMGTPLYMSPEQARGDQVDARTDIWSLGVVFYEMVAGKPPFVGSTVTEVIKSILESEAPPFSLPGGDVLTELESITRTALAKKAEHRYRDATELLLSLNKLRRMIDSGSELIGGHQSKNLDQDNCQLGGGYATVRDEEKQPVLSERASAQVSGKRYSRKSIKSLAILPFVNESSDPKAEYLSDGVTETIINNLSQLPQVRVMSRSSVFLFKGSQEDPRTIGARLGVAAVVTGRLLRVGSRLVIRAELVDVADGSQLWGDSFNRRAADIFEIQDEIAKEISEKLQLKLSARQRRRLLKRHTVNEQAYLSYLKGRFHWNKRSAEALKVGADYFQEAIETEPLYALAFAGLADSYVALGGLHSMPADEAYPKARAAATKALGIDDSLAEAYATLGFVMATYDRDWSGSERAFQKAITLNPSYATAHQWYSVILRSLGRFEEAILESLKADELDPLSPVINATVGQSYYFARRYDQAIKRYNRMLTIKSGYHWTHYFLGCAYRQIDRYEDAIAEFELALDLLKSDPVIISDLAYTYALSGRKPQATSLVAQLEGMSARVYVSPYDLAVAYLGLGDRDAAFDLLEEAFREHDDGLLMIKIDPLLDSLRSEIRFHDLLVRVGLEEPTGGLQTVHSAS